MDNSLLTHTDNSIIPGGLDNTKITTEAKYFVNKENLSRKSRKKICLSLHYNPRNKFLYAMVQKSIISKQINLKQNHVHYVLKWFQKILQLVIWKKTDWMEECTIFLLTKVLLILVILSTLISIREKNLLYKCLDSLRKCLLF